MVTEPVPSSTETSENSRRPSRVLATVLQLQGDLRRVVAGALQLAAGQFAAQAQQGGGRLGDVDVDRVELLHGGHRVGLAVGHQGAFGHRGTADAAGDRRQHLGVAQVDPRLLHRRLGLQVGGIGVGVLLLAHGLVGDQQLVALGLLLGRSQVGLGALVVGLVGGGVDLVELLPGLDVAAFLEQALEDDAVHLGTHLGDAERIGPARQLGIQGHRLRFQGHDPDLRRLRRRRRLAFSAPGKGRNRDQQGRNQYTHGWRSLHSVVLMSESGRCSVKALHRLEEGRQNTYIHRCL